MLRTSTWLPVKKSALQALLRRAYIFPIALLVVGALLAINETGYRQSKLAAAEAEIAQSRRAHLNLLLQNILDAETGQRGYLLTGSQRYLEPYSHAVAQISGNLDRLRGLYMRDEVPLGEFAVLSRSVSKKLGEMEVTVRMRKLAVGMSEWRAVVETNLGQDYMDAIREQANKLISDSSTDRAKSMERVHRSLDVSRIGIVLACLTGLIAFHLYLRAVKRVGDADEAQRRLLDHDKKRLEAEVHQRTESLAELTNHLQTVQEQEREHLARELHDELGSILTAAKLDVARIRSKIPDTLPELHDRISHLVETLNNGIALKRRIIEDLRPSSLGNLGLVAALEILAREFQERSGTSVVAELEPTELADDAALTIFRMVQESLTNAAKYASSTEITLSLHNYADRVEVVVEDNGKGFEAHLKQGGTFGLKGMRHRIEALRGTLSITSGPGRGTRLAAMIPKPVSLIRSHVDYPAATVALPNPAGLPDIVTQRA